MLKPNEVQEIERAQKNESMIFYTPTRSVRINNTQSNNTNISGNNHYCFKPFFPRGKHVTLITENPTIHNSSSKG